MTAATVQAQSGRKLSFTRVLLAGAIAIVVASVANALIGWLAVNLFGIGANFLPLANLPFTMILSAILLVLATVVFLVINAFASNPARVFNIVALVALLLSLIPDVMLLVNPGSFPPEMGTATLGAVIVLMVQHIVAYLAAVWAFTRWAPQA